jgi:CHAT domain-containing protein/tetratricopeptide (TPR) repeat protein
MKLKWGMWVLAGWLAWGGGTAAHAADDVASLTQRVAQCMSAGQWLQALPLQQKLLAVTEQTSGQGSEPACYQMEALARTESFLGLLPQAAVMYERARLGWSNLDLRKQGPRHRQDALRCTVDRCEVLVRMGEFEEAHGLQEAVLANGEASPLMRAMVAVQRADMGEYASAWKVLDELPQVSNDAITNLSRGLIAQQLGDGRTAEACFKACIEVAMPQTREYFYSALGAFYLKFKDYPHALTAYAKATPDPAAPALSAVCQAHLGHAAAALPMLGQALATSEKGSGPLSQQTIEYRILLANVAHLARHLPLAREQYDLLLRDGLQRVPAVDRHNIMRGLAEVMISQSQTAEAARLAADLEKAEDAMLGQVLSFTDEQQRLQYVATIDPYLLWAALGSGPDMARAVLRHKGIVLDSMIEDERLGDGDTARELRAARTRLNALRLRHPDRIGDLATQQAEARVHQLESALAGQVAAGGTTRTELTVDPAQVQQRLRSDSVLLDIVRYNRYPHDPTLEPYGNTVQAYGAVLLAPSGPPQWIPLDGDASDIERLVGLYMKRASNSTDRELKPILNALYDRLWIPLASHFPATTKRVLLSPDGQLNFVSFATLLGPDGKFVGEKFDVSYLSSGRDLLRQPVPPAPEGVQIFANPDFDHGAGRSPSENHASNRDLTLGERVQFTAMHFDPLPGTAEEGAMLARLADSWHVPAEVHSQQHATRQALMQLHAPRYLHLATHGFILPEVASNDLDFSLAHQMMRSGLALAGANMTAADWASGRVPSAADDGILSAADAGTLDLRGTTLVTLSACQTARGEARAGEGVLGLRRGFVQSGASHLLMTLWPIDDAATVKFMRDFYEAARTADPAIALAQTQRKWLVKLRAEGGLATAVSIAGPFIMSSVGPAAASR